MKFLNAGTTDGDWSVSGRMTAAELRATGGLIMGSDGVGAGVNYDGITYSDSTNTFYFLADAADNTQTTGTGNIVARQVILTNTTDASTAVGNRPPLLIGDLALQHLRIDNNEMISVSKDDGTTVTLGGWGITASSMQITAPLGVTGAASITGTAVGSTVLNVKGVAGQTANLLQVQSSTATNFFSVSTAGDATVLGQLSVGGGTGLIDMYGNATFTSMISQSGGSFGGPLTVSGTLTVGTSAALILGNTASSTQAIQYLRKATDTLDHAFESRTYLYGGASTSGWSTVLYQDSVLASRINMSPTDLQFQRGSGTTWGVPLTPGGTSTSFNWGVKATTTDANGVATIAHGLGVVPSTVLCVQQAGSGGSGTNYICRPNSGSYTATNFSFVAKSDAGAVLVSAAITVMWFVGQ